MPHEQSFNIETSVLSVWETNSPSCGYFCCLALPLLRASGKDEAMKRTPKTPVEFDYDLWTTEDGKCMVRVKSTGEVTEVDREVMKALRAEEKRMRRSFSTEPSEEEQENGGNTILSLDALPDDDVKSSAWLADPSNFENELTLSLLEKELLCSLTSKQKLVYFACVKEGMSYAKCASILGISYQGVQQTMTLIRKKASKIFF